MKKKNNQRSIKFSNIKPKIIVQLMGLLETGALLEVLLV